MKRNTRLLASSFAAAALVLLPLTGFARARPEDEADLLARLHTQKTPEIYETARSLGEIGSVEGLKTVIGFADSQCLQQYRLGFEFSPRADGAVEQIIIDHYGEPKLRPELVWLINESHPYHTRTLFDLLAATIKDPATPKTQRDNTAWSITQTDLPIDDDLFALLRTLPPDTTGNSAAGKLIRHLGERRYVPLVAYLRTIVPTAPVGTLWNHCAALARIGTEESLDVAIPGIARLSTEGKNRDGLDGQLSSVIGHLAELPPTTPLKLSILKHALPMPLGKLATMKYIALIQHRHDPTGVPDLIAYLQTDSKEPGAPYRAALDALLDFESPDVWRQALREIEQQHGADRLNERQYQFASTALQRQLKDPEKFSQYKRQQETAAKERQEHNEEWQRRTAARERLEPLRRSNPQRWVQEYAQYLANLESAAKAHPERAQLVGSKMQLDYEYATLATFARFRLKDFKGALALYDKALNCTGIPGGGPTAWMTELELADLYTHELADKPQAIAHYQRALATWQTYAHTTPGADLFGDGWTRWIEHQIHYLQTGEPFSGSLGRADVMNALMLPLMYQGVGETGAIPALDDLFRDADTMLHEKNIDRDKLQRTLETLPHAQRIFVTTFPLLALLPADTILRYLEGQDPGRYLSACILGAALLQARLLESRPCHDDERRAGLFPTQTLRDVASAPGALLTAADRFAQRAGVRFDLDPDPRFTSPEQTWKSFLAALSAGDGPSVLSCLTPEFAKRLQPLLIQMSPGDMQAMATSFITFERSNTGCIMEYSVSRLAHGELRGGLIYFEDECGEWKISTM